MPTTGSVTPTAAPDRTSARERLLAAANELFYAEGIRTVGIDRIIEHAGVAKASLYNTFGSKDELIRAYLGQRHARTAERITRALESAPPKDPMGVRAPETMTILGADISPPPPRVAPAPRHQRHPGCIPRRAAHRDRRRPTADG